MMMIKMMELTGEVHSGQKTILTTLGLLSPDSNLRPDVNYEDGDDGDSDADAHSGGDDGK